MKTYQAVFIFDSGERVVWRNLEKESVLEISRHIANGASFVEFWREEVPGDIIMTKNLNSVEYREEE